MSDTIDRPTYHGVKIISVTGAKIGGVVPVSFISWIPDTDHPIQGPLVDAIAGSTVEQCLVDALRVAQGLGMELTLRHNGILIPVKETDTVEELAARSKFRPCPFEVWSATTADRLQRETLHRKSAMLFYLAGLAALTSEWAQGSAFSVRVWQSVSRRYREDAEKALTELRAMQLELEEEDRKTQERLQRSWNVGRVPPGDG